MSADKNTSKNRVTLDLDVEDIINLVSSPKTPSSTNNHYNSYEAESLKKAWYEHMLISLEKLNGLIEDIRRIDIINVRNEYREDIKILGNKLEKLETELNYKITKFEDENKSYREKVITPLNNKLITLTAKLAVWATVAGFVGSGISALLFYIIKEYLIKPQVVGGP